MATRFSRLSAYLKRNRVFSHQQHPRDRVCSAMTQLFYPCRRPVPTVEDDDRRLDADEAPVRALGCTDQRAGYRLRRSRQRAHMCAGVCLAREYGGCPSVSRPAVRYSQSGNVLGHYLDPEAAHWPAREDPPSERRTSGEGDLDTQDEPVGAGKRSRWELETPRSAAGASNASPGQLACDVIQNLRAEDCSSRNCISSTESEGSPSSWRRPPTRR